MSVIPCKENADLQVKIEEFAEALKTRAHELGNHGLTEKEFYGTGVFRGAIERIRGQFSAITLEKRIFAQHVLNHLQDGGFIGEWNASEGDNRLSYTVAMPGGRTAVLELKGCLDGANTNNFDRPAEADEFVVWSLCTNAAADPRLNAWSGIHTRLGSKLFTSGQPVDGLIIWDMLCNTIGRPCPKVTHDDPRITELENLRLPPPCIYLMPSTLPALPNNGTPQPQGLDEVHILKAFAGGFNANQADLNEVQYTIAAAGVDAVRSTVVKREGVVQRQSRVKLIRRT